MNMYKLRLGSALFNWEKMLVYEGSWYGNILSITNNLAVWIFFSSNRDAHANMATIQSVGIDISSFQLGT